MAPQQELVDDLLTVMRSFSGRLDGLQRYEKELEGAELAVGDER